MKPVLFFCGHAWQKNNSSNSFALFLLIYSLKFSLLLFYYKILQCLDQNVFKSIYLATLYLNYLLPKRSAALPNFIHNIVLSCLLRLSFRMYLVICIQYICLKEYRQLSADREKNKFLATRSLLYIVRSAIFLYLQRD